MNSSGDIAVPEDFQYEPEYLERRSASHRAALYCFVFVMGFIVFLMHEWIRGGAYWGANTRLLGTVCMLLGAWPAAVYLFRGGYTNIPFFEGHCLFYVLSLGYAAFRPIVVGGRLGTLIETDLQKGLIAAIICLVMLQLGFYVIGELLFRGVRKHTLGVADEPSVVLLFFAATFVGVMFFGALRYFGLGGVSQPASALWSFSAAVITAAVHAGVVAKWIRYVFWFGFLPWVALTRVGFVDQGNLGGLISIGMGQSIAFLWAKQRLPVIWIIAVVAVVFILQPIKGMYRVVLRERSVSSSRLDQLQLWWAMATDESLLHDREERVAYMRESSYSRMNHLVVTSGVIRDTPELEPFQKGVTYWPLFVKWIPRMIWPNKPIEDLGNSWARRYGYLNHDDYLTSFNLPWLTEMFMNFGWWGVFILPLLIGVVFRGLWQKFGRNRRTVLDYAFGYSTLGGLILVESHLSMKFGGTVIRLLVLLTILAMLKYYVRLFSVKARFSISSAKGSSQVV